jgi:hypothetical protein
VTGAVPGRPGGARNVARHSGARQFCLTPFGTIFVGAVISVSLAVALPGDAVRDGRTAVFHAALAIMVLGMALRTWAVLVLGRFLTIVVLGVFQLFSAMTRSWVLVACARYQRSWRRANTRFPVTVSVDARTGLASMAVPTGVRSSIRAS